MGHEVLQAPSATARLPTVEAQPMDLLVSDYAMPRTTGVELIEKASQIRPGLRAIIVSGYADLPEGNEIRVPRLAKPFTDAQLAYINSAVAG